MNPSLVLPARIGLIVGVLLLITGCGKDRPEHKYTTREGTALDIDLNGGVSMEFVSEKGIRMTGKGAVAEDAEVWINGKQAALGDVRRGDHIKVTLRVEGSGMNKGFIATKIEVERDAFESTSQPAASQPDAATEKASAEES